MSCSAPTFALAEHTGMDRCVTNSAPSFAWAFWLSLAAVLSALYTVEHSAYFASHEYLAKGDGNDVAEAVAGGSSLRQLSIVLLGGLGTALLLIPATVNVALRPVPASLIALACSLLVFSGAWADDAELSFKRAVQPLLLMIAAIGIAKHLSPHQVCKFVALATGVMLGVGLGVALLHGTLLQGSAYRFGGTLHPNAQAVNCMLLALSALALANDDYDARNRCWWWLAFGAGVIFLLLTRSRTAMMAFGVSFATFYWLGAPARRKCAIVAVLGAVAFGGLILILLPDTGLNDFALDLVSMGRANVDMGSLTGRLPIWQTVLRDIGERPMQGYGYGAFWTPQRVWEHSFIHRWEFNHAHSAYLETLLNVGIVGLSLGLLVLIWALGAAATAFRGTRDVGYRFAFAMMVAALVHGLIDSNFVIVGFAPLVVMLCIATVAIWRRDLSAPSIEIHYLRRVGPDFRTALNY